MLDVLDSLRESLAPRFDVERQIGAGGMARVYLAVEQHPRRRVAIKVLDPEISTRLLRERFIREVDLSSKLSHPHIVPIFAAGEAAGLFYYVMPYVEGESLRHRLLRERKLALADALHITRDVADALGFAHAQGIIHRDIKPENILLTGDHAIVADFGIARAISAAGTLTLTQTGQSMGSPGYMSPEQAIGSGQLDARTDVYSLGCVLFEMLAGEPRVMSLTERLIHNWSALESSPALRRADANVARAVKHAVSKALAPLPDDRFPTAGALAAAPGGSPHRTSVPTRGILAGRRGRRVLAGAGLLAVGLGGAGVGRPGRAPGLQPRPGVGARLREYTRAPAPACQGGAGDVVGLAPRPWGDDRQSTAQLPGLPGVHRGLGPVRPVRHARGDRTLRAGVGGRHDVPAAPHLRRERSHEPRRVCGSGCHRPRPGAARRAARSARPVLPGVGAGDVPG